MEKSYHSSTLPRMVPATTTPIEFSCGGRTTASASPPPPAGAVDSACDDDAAPSSPRAPAIIGEVDVVASPYSSIPPGRPARGAGSAAARPHGRHPQPLL